MILNGFRLFAGNDDLDAADRLLPAAQGAGDVRLQNCGQGLKVLQQPLAFFEGVIQ